MYDSIKKSISTLHNTDTGDLVKFLEELPHDLKLEASLFIYEKTFKKIIFLKDRPITFIAWICPILKPFIKSEDQYVFFEGDDISCIYFHKKGTVGYVLPRHHNLMYIKIGKG